MLPQGWILTTFHLPILEIFGGGTPSKDSPDYWNGSIPWCSVKDLGKNKYISNTICSITKKGLENSSSKIVKAGNIILCTRISIGKIRIPTIDMAINQDLKGITLSSYFVQDFFIICVKATSLKGTGTTVKGIHINSFLSLPIFLPPLKEQIKIVAKIDLLNQLIE